MTHTLLDIAFPPSDPAGLVRDLDAAGADSIGLYVVNWSVPSAVQAGTYVQGVLAAGTAVLPIVTPGNTPGPASAILSALDGWGVSGCPVAFDIEQYSFPAQSWVAGACQALTGAGYFPGIYGLASTHSSYAGLGQKWSWLANWDGQPTIPPGYQAKQYTNTFVGPSGARYDTSVVVDSLTFGGIDMTLTDLDSLAVRVAGIQPTHPGEQPGAAFVRWMQATLGTEETNYNTLGTIRADVEAIAAQVQRLATVSGADPAALASAVVNAIKQQWAK
jgi:hypothetical protein